jgi:hypothetical protein
MSNISLTRIDTVAAKHDPWTAALMDDYETPKAAHIFVGRGLEDNERVAFFIGKDGGGIGFIDRDPAGYIEMSKALAAGNHDLGGVPFHPGPDEYEFDEGTFNYNAKSIVQEAIMSLF